jgi:uncharacterized protein DUF5681
MIAASRIFDVKELRMRKRMIDKENASSAQGAENRRKTGKPTRAARLAEIGKRTRFKPGQKSANPNGRPRTAKFGEAMRQLLAEVNPSSGESNAELLARHCFQEAIAGSARHLGLALSYVEGKPPQAFELSGRNGSSIEIASMTDAELTARMAELLGISLLPTAPPNDDPALPALPTITLAAALPPVAPAIDNSTVAERVEIVPAATAQAPAPAGVTVPKTQTPVPAAPQAKPLSGTARDQAYFQYTTGTAVVGPATEPNTPRQAAGNAKKC